MEGSFRHRSAQLLPVTLILQAGQVRPRGSDWIYLKSNLSSGLLCKESACNAGDPGLIPGLGRSPGEGNGNPLKYSFLGNPMDIGTWQAVAHGVTESDMTGRLTL